MPERSRIAAFTFRIKKPSSWDFLSLAGGVGTCKQLECLVVTYKYEIATYKFNLEVQKLDVCAIMHRNSCSCVFE